MPYKDPEKRRAKNREYQRRHRARNSVVPPGICSQYPGCKRKVEGDFKLCLRCREYRQNWKKGYLQKEAPPGICSHYPNCANPARKGKKQCQRCFDKSSAWSKSPEGRAAISARNHAIKLEVLEAYGGSCACCGEDATHEFLTIDHVTRYDGTTPRSGSQLYRYLKRNNWPEGFRVLCYNCNGCLGMRGYCVHSSLKQGGLRCTDEPRTPQQEKQVRIHLRYKRSALMRYGGVQCACCGDEHIELLTLDHINGDGGEHRRTDPGAKNLYHWVRQNDYPPGFRVLCFNCNLSCSRSEDMVCFHQRSASAA